MRWFIVVGLLCAGCSGGLPDFDGDGSTDEADCRPSDPLAFPGADDPLDDGIDQNCDGVDGLDGDGDGYASAASGGPDCNDAAPEVNPGATEVPDNDVDEDCDGVVLRCDVDSDGAVAIVCGGADCDDFDSLCRTDEDCEDADSDGVVLCAGDCDEDNDTVYPKAVELCDGLDNDCDDELPAIEADADGDGVMECAGDCDDAAATAYPGATEVCDGLDSDCDGAVPADEGDGDGDGDPTCSDCDDADPLRGTNLPEACDGIDNDCDGIVRPGGAFGELDNDGDGAAECAGDCNDFDASIGPSEADGCDGVDTDCNGIVDDIDDLDGDGWCAGDCDDADPTRFPTQWDDPGDGVDDDCDGTEDTDLDAGFPWIDGTQPGEMCGYAVVGGADWDGDGVPELVIGCPKWSDGAGEPGRACIVPGGNLPTGGGIDLSAASWCVQGRYDARLGSSLATGDLDGDGVDDLIVGGLASPGDVGIFWGSGLGSATGATAITAADLLIEGGSAAESLATGDVDGDGLDDLVVGAEDWSNQGRADVFLGAVLAAAASPIDETARHLSIQGASANDFFGSSIAVADVDGDGLAEILVGARGYGGVWSPGAAFLYLGTSLAAPGVLTPSDAMFWLDGSPSTQPPMLGQSVLLADVDGDTFADLVAGAPLAYAPSGGPQVGLLATISGATLQPGVMPLESSPILHEGSAFYDSLGAALGRADVDGDGAQDVLVSGHHHVACRPGNTGAESTAFVLTGASLAPGRSLADDVAVASFVTSTPMACLGAGLAGVGDLDDDGKEDIALGAPNPGSSTEPGRVYVLLSPY